MRSTPTQALEAFEILKKLNISPIEFPEAAAVFILFEVIIPSTLYLRDEKKLKKFTLTHLKELGLEEALTFYQDCLDKSRFTKSTRNEALEALETAIENYYRNRLRINPEEVYAKAFKISILNYITKVYANLEKNFNLMDIQQKSSRLG